MLSSHCYGQSSVFKVGRLELFGIYEANVAEAFGWDCRVGNFQSSEVTKSKARGNRRRVAANCVEPLPLKVET
jgi:hypothetical protein